MTTPLTHVLTLVARRDATSLTPAIVGRVRDAVRGGPAEILSAREAAEIRVPAPPDPVLLRAVLEGQPIDAITVKARGRRKALLIADMDSTSSDGGDAG